MLSYSRAAITTWQHLCAEHMGDLPADRQGSWDVPPFLLAEVGWAGPWSGLLKKTREVWCREPGLPFGWVGRQNQTVLVTAKFLRLFLHTTNSPGTSLTCGEMRLFNLSGRSLRLPQIISAMHSHCQAACAQGARPAHSSTQQLRGEKFWQ